MADKEISGWGAIAVAAYLGIGLIPVIIVFGPLILVHPMITGQVIIVAYKLFKLKKSPADVATELGIENSVEILKKIKEGLENLGVL